MPTVWIQTGTIVSGYVTATTTASYQPLGGWPEGWEWKGASGLYVDNTEGLISGSIITFGSPVPGIVDGKEYYIWTVDTATNIITISEYGNMQANELADNAIWNTSSGTNGVYATGVDLPVPWDGAVINSLEELSVTSGTFTATVFTATPLNATWVTGPIAIVSSGTGYTPGVYSAVSMCSTGEDDIINIRARATVTVNEGGHVSQISNIVLFDTVTPVGEGQLMTFDAVEVGETGFGFLAGISSLEVDSSTVVNATTEFSNTLMFAALAAPAALLTTVDNGIVHIPVQGNIVIDLSKTFNMETFFQTIQLSYPTDPGLTVVGISIPLVQVACKNIGIINPIDDIKEAISNLYNYCMKSVFQPIWKLLKKILKALERVLGVININTNLPVFNLTFSDLFSNDLYDKVKARITELYYSARDQITAILNLLKIKDPIFADIQSPELEIEQIVKHIIMSLWDSLLKAIAQVMGYIKTGLVLWDILTKGKPYPLTPIWNSAIDAFLAKVISFFTLPPGITEIYDALKAWAEQLYNKAEATYYDMVRALSEFKLPVFGKPFDWSLPLNLNVDAPNLDLSKILGDIKRWISNYLLSLLQSFVRAIVRILKIFGLSFTVPKIRIPITLCAIRV